MHRDLSNDVAHRYLRPFGIDTPQFVLVVRTNGIQRGYMKERKQAQGISYFAFNFSGSWRGALRSRWMICMVENPGLGRHVTAPPAAPGNLAAPSGHH